MMVRVVVGLPMLGALFVASPALAQQAQEPVFSAARGYYSAPLQVTLTSPTANASIHYTVDGSTPSANSGSVFSGPITITTTTVLRALTSAPGLTDSPVVTHTYLFPVDILHQGNAPPGYPAFFAAPDERGPYPADYEMDPEIVGDSVYGPLLGDALQGLPAISLVTDMSNLWDEYTGIYFNALQEGTLWERPVSVEWIPLSAGNGFGVNAGLRVHGGASRKPSVTPKKSFRIYFRGEYGVPKLLWNLFEDPHASPAFDVLLLRAGTNDTWLHWRSAFRSGALYARDGFARTTQLEMGHPNAHGRFVHLYINGLYWGVYDLTERPDADFITDYLGGSASEWDVISPEGGALEASSGTMDAFFQLMSTVNAGVAGNQEYAAVGQLCDLTNLADHMILVHYLGDTDGPDKNWVSMRRRKAGETFKFMVWDAEQTLSDVNINMLTQDADGSPSRLFVRLIQNPEFKILFADRIYKHLAAGGVLTPERAAARFQGLATQLELPILDESARWGDYTRDVYHRLGEPDAEPLTLYTRDHHWIPQRDGLLQTFFPERTRLLMAQYRALGLYPDLQPPSFSNPGGQITEGTVLVLDNGGNNNAGEVVYTLDGSDPRAPGGDVSATAQHGPGPVNVTLTGPAVVKARVHHGTTWSALNQALFITAQPWSNLVINELMFNPPTGMGAVSSDDLEFIELKNKGATRLSLAGVRFSKGITYQFPADAFLEPGGFAVVAASSLDFEQRYGFTPMGQYTGRLNNRGETVELRDGNDALIDQVAYGTTDPWPTQPDGTGSSLELRDSAANHADPGNWGSSEMVGGTPGEENTLAQGGTSTSGAGTTSNTQPQSSSSTSGMGSSTTSGTLSSSADSTSHGMSGIPGNSSRDLLDDDSSLTDDRKNEQTCGCHQSNAHSLPVSPLALLVLMGWLLPRARRSTVHKR